MKIYVIMKRGYEYNDEYYTETEGGDLVKGFLDKDKAQNECDRMMGEWVRNNSECTSEDGHLVGGYYLQELEVDKSDCTFVTGVR
jgi:hypothetical protein